MEEVVGSIPTRSTKSPNNLDGANRAAEGARRLFPGVVVSLRFSISPSRSPGSLAAIFQETNLGRAALSDSRGVVRRSGVVQPISRTLAHEPARLRIEETA
jgi:hypothetical protein